MKVLIEVSARHVHLTQEDVETLFGSDSTLEPDRPLSTPRLFAAKQKVDVVGPRNTLHNVTILGPTRKYSQVELSKTDARTLGIDAPVRESGKLDGTPGCVLVGPAGSLELKAGVIIARRHIHIQQSVADELGIKSGDCVGIDIHEGERSLVFRDVVARPSDKLTNTFVHIDTDEGNAAGIKGRSAYGELIVLK